MKPATRSKRYFEATRLLVLQLDGAIQHSHVAHLADFFKPDDVLVVNRSATLPSSFRGLIKRSNEAIELRLAALQGVDKTDLRRWKAVTFGEGDWRSPTERRGAAPRLKRGDRIQIAPDLLSEVVSVDPKFPRLIEIKFKSENLTRALFEHGRPIQYSYLEEEIQTWDQQTLFASAPVSVEPPSAAFPLNWRLLFELKQKGVEILPLIHGAGLSSTGDEEFDKVFPLEEFYEIPNETSHQIAKAKAQGRRIIALGTTVTRALESAFRAQPTPHLSGRTDLRLQSGASLKIVDGILTGMHEEATSHFDLMRAVSRSDRFLEKLDVATRDYRSHEYGDLTLILRS